MKNDNYLSYSSNSRDQARFDAQIKHDQFKRKINERPKRKNKRKK
ncbi:hypothetical protein [Carnobacterium pleistocenium]|nr:hypothetical protein [Carnobacterium pleistocenium]